MFPQPNRPDHRHLQFVPLTTSEPNDTDITIKLSLLCPQCKKIQNWMETNILEIRSWTTADVPSAIPHHHKTFTHYESGRDLEASFRRGCHLCTIIWDSLTAKHSIWDLAQPGINVPKKIREGSDITSTRNGGLVSIRVGMPESGNGVIVEGPVATLYPDIKKKRAFFRDLSATIKRQQGIRWHNGRRIHVASERVSEQSLCATLPAASSPLSTKSQDSLRLIRQWLTTCSTEHTQCSPQTPGNLPTRLLRVYSPEPGARVSARLTETRDAASLKTTDHRYAALSYCWGGQGNVTLTAANYEPMTREVPVDRLPRTIQDALWLTVQMGLTWIWIDSLCIIQDSAADWAAEAARMGQVYRGSFVTIAARGAKNASEGLFSRRDPLRHASCHLFREAPDGCSIVACSQYPWQLAQEFAKWPLEERGWVVQERFLPSKTIKLGSFLSWDCREAAVSEFDVERGVADVRDGAGNVGRPHLRRMVQLFSQSILQVNGGDGELDNDGRYKLWVTILEEYSAATLSVAGDRLTALAGIVAAFRERTGWKYMSGLWEPFLLHGLLWRISWYAGSRVTGNTVRPTGIRPTWSWGAISCGVSSTAYTAESYPDSAALAITTECTEIGRTTQRTGGLDSGPVALQARGSFFEIRSATQDYASMRLQVQGWPESETVSCDYDLDVQLPLESQLFLPLLMHPVKVEGLVIQKSQDRPGAFERVGIWTSSSVTVRLGEADAGARRHEIREAMRARGQRQLILV